MAKIDPLHSCSLILDGVTCANTLEGFLDGINKRVDVARGFVTERADGKGLLGSEPRVGHHRIGTRWLRSGEAQVRERRTLFPLEQKGELPRSSDRIGVLVHERYDSRARYPHRAPFTPRSKGAPASGTGQPTSRSPTPTGRPIRPRPTKRRPAAAAMFCQFPVVSPAATTRGRSTSVRAEHPLSGTWRSAKGSGYWDGTTFGGVSRVTDGISVAAPARPGPTRLRDRSAPARSP